MLPRLLMELTNLKSTAIDYLRLTSPGIILLVLLTAFTGIWIGSKGINMKLSFTLWSLLALGLASSGACMLNNWYDRETDRLMVRTRMRPLASGRLDPQKVLLLALFLIFLAVLILLVYGNTLSTVLTLIGIIIYSYLYTVLLKKRTPWATVIGGFSGALPPAIGWALVKGSLGVEALILFGLLFFWQPPHFWSLAVKYREDYATAAIPTLPVVRHKKDVGNSCMIYISILLLISILPYIKGMAGGYYLITALILGIFYLILVFLDFRAQKHPTIATFSYSIVYLVLLLTVMIIDTT